MDNESKLKILMTATMALFEECLTSIAAETLDDYDNQMSQMTTEQQIEFIVRKTEENPFTELKKSLEKLETTYNDYQNDPMLQAEAQAMFEQMLNEMNQYTLLTDETNKESNEDDDDTTKH